MKKIFRDNALELHVIDREKIKRDDKRFEECLDVIAGWRTNLDKLYELDNEFRLIVEYPTERYLEEIKELDFGSEEYEDKLCEIIEEIVFKKMEEEKIDFHKLHYGLEVVEGITYEYSHITNEDHQELLDKYDTRWYKITCVVPYPQVHRDVFYVPQNELHNFFEKDVYKTYNGTRRKIIDIKQLSKEEAESELQAIKEKIKEHEKNEYRKNEAKS